MGETLWGRMVLSLFLIDKQGDWDLPPRGRVTGTESFRYTHRGGLEGSKTRKGLFTAYPQQNFLGILV
jgi:hypothetical protein